MDPRIREDDMLNDKILNLPAGRLKYFKFNSNF